MIDPRIPEDHIFNRRPRLVGIILITVGLLLAKWQIYDPLHAAEQRKEQVWILSYLVGAGVYLPALGFLQLLFGNRPNRWFAFDPQKLSLKNTVSLLLFGGIGIAVIFFVIASLESQGYVVKYGW
jgi:hypothetical protein